MKKDHEIRPSNTDLNKFQSSDYLTRSKWKGAFLRRVPIGVRKFLEDDNPLFFQFSNSRSRFATRCLHKENDIKTIKKTDSNIIRFLTLWSKVHKQRLSRIQFTDVNIWKKIYVRWI